MANPTSSSDSLDPLLPPQEATAASAESNAPSADAGPHCPACDWLIVPGSESCPDCGLILKQANSEALSPPAKRLRDRYEVGSVIAERGGVIRYHGCDHEAGAVPRPVVIVRAAAPPLAEAVEESEKPESATEPSPSPQTDDDSVELTPTFDLQDQATLHQPHPTLRTGRTGEIPPPPWPGVDWEQALLLRMSQGRLPSIHDRFTENQFDYLILEQPQGRPFWDAWDDPSTTESQRYEWLRQIAETLRELQWLGVTLEGLRPEHVTVCGQGESASIILSDLSDLLPLPPPPDAALRASPYTAPELIASPELADGRVGLYSFGAMMYSLYLGRELTELDFVAPGMPHPFLERFPDVHPAIGRLIAKTFCRDPQSRFPTDDWAAKDPSGFEELLHTLETTASYLSQIRLEIGAWTTTGMVRSGNEDSFAVIHGSHASEDSLDESALLLLADGMGGTDGGEVAARLTVRTLRELLVRDVPFDAWGRCEAPAADPVTPFRLPPTLTSTQATPLIGSLYFESGIVARLDRVNQEPMAAARRRIEQALREANRRVFEASRQRGAKRGMGCTAEAVFIDGGYLVIGHVGDSRCYRLRRGELKQLTRDQTPVARLVELGHLTPEEAEYHPRRSELQQAIGGRPDVEPELVVEPLLAGDWLLVCSDGLTNQIRPAMLQEVLEKAGSAERAARRLVNLANCEGANDNVTVIVVRAC